MAWIVKNLARHQLGPYWPKYLILNFTVPVSAIFLLLAIWRIWTLYKCDQRIHGRILVTAKTVFFVAIIALELTQLVLWCTSPAHKTRASIPSAALSFIVSLAIPPLSWLEHRSSIRPSPFLTFYLLFSNLLNLAQVRTLWLTDIKTSIPAVFSASFAAKGALLLLESVNKSRFIIQENDVKPTPEDTSGVISRSFYFWMNELIHRGFRSALILEKLYPTSAEAATDKLELKLNQAWNQTTSYQKHQLLIATVMAHKKHLFSAFLPRLAMIAFTICQPLLVRRIITFLNDQPESPNVGYGLVGAYALVYLGIATSTAWFWYQHNKVISAVRASLVALIYSKTLTLGLASIDKASSVTIMTADVERIIFGMRNIHEIWANFVQVAIAAWLLEIQTGLAVVAPLVVAAACALITMKVGALAGPRQGEWLTAIQTRIGVTSTTLSAMRGVKMSGLTQNLLDIIQGLRKTELTAASKFRRWIIAAAVLGYIPQLISPVLTFAIFVAVANAQHRVLDAATMFTSLSFLALIAAPLIILFQSVPGFMSMIVCFNRIEKFIQTGQQPNTQNTKSPVGSDTLLSEKVSSSDTIDIVDASFAWSKESGVILHNVYLSIPRGKLTFVIGPVGCGKSTLLKALLGEVSSETGNVDTINESIAFCDQTPWIFNGTLKENVCMFSDGKDPYYNSVIKACGLGDDLKQLPRGDQANLGSKGITLSGGQKQRLSLARLLFARRSFNLCDDILSGLDSTTAMHVFAHVFGPHGLLTRNGATTVVATHAVHLLPYADHIICIGSDGHITEQGTFPELQHKGGYVARLSIAESQGLPSIDDTAASATSPALSTDKESRSEEADELIEHTQPKGAYRFYSKAIGTTPSIIYIFLGMSYAFLTNFPYIWTKWWADENERSPGSRQAYYMGIYAMLQVLCLALLGFTGWHGIITVVSFGGRALHWSLLSTALNAPLSFFEKTDTGKTLNRFSQDMQLIDSELPQSLFNVITLSLTLIGQFLLVINASYWLALSFPAIGLFVWTLQKVYLRTSCRLRHLELETKSPLYTQFLESVDGLATIRAYAWQPNFLRLYHKRLDDSQRPFYLLMCLQKWLALVLDTFSAGFVTLVVGLIVGLRENISPGFAGVALSNILNLSQLMSLFVKTWTQLETSVASVERVRSFQKDTPSEVEGEMQEPPPSWPERGHVKIENLEATYRDGATKALQNLSMDIKPGEKIGVCGRTGSGKTSLMLALFRMITISQGTILIDDIDISRIPPNHLRSSLTAIPQEPYFFSGTIKDNADPSSTKTYAEIWSALDAVRLRTVIESKGGLSTKMTDATLSHGEKQLFCLARAILKKSSIVVLDEATSNIDIETDRLIQDTIRTQFAKCTVITIAHRLESILGCDRVAVLEGGVLVEFEEPDGLLRRESRFKAFYDAYSRG